MEKVSYADPPSQVNSPCNTMTTEQIEEMAVDMARDVADIIVNRLIKITIENITITCMMILSIYIS